MSVLVTRLDDKVVVRNCTALLSVAREEHNMQAKQFHFHRHSAVQSKRIVSHTLRLRRARSATIDVPITSSSTTAGSVAADTTTTKLQLLEISAGLNRGTLAL